MLGGYSLFAFPIAMVSAHFVQPFIIDGVPLEPQFLLVSFLWTAGIPLVLMAFIVPVVFLNEAVQKRSVGFIQRFARRLAAGEVEKPVISSKGATKAEEEIPEEPAEEQLDF